MPEPTFRGHVKFFMSDRGWGGIESDAVQGDVYVSYSVIQSDAYRELRPGEDVEFRFEESTSGSFRYRATWVRRLGEQPRA
jgi:CspA family cold shock protein